MLIKEMEEYAKEHNVPIMQEEGLSFILDFIKEHNIKRILEIGSAIGYSAIRMAMLDDSIHVTTIERDDERYQKACENLAKSTCQKQIRIYHADALEAVIDGEYDLLFIDAAKAQYQRFFERYESNLKQGGYIISDNLSFHGYVEHPEREMSRSLRQLVRKIRNFRLYLESRDDYKTEYYELGDGIAVSRKK